MGLREELFADYKISEDWKRPPALSVPTPEWPKFDGQIYVRKLTAGELDLFWKNEDAGSERARFVALVACDANSYPLFKETDVGDLAGLAFEPVDRIAQKGQWFNGMLPEQREARQKN